jgi:hypothetical protein
MLLYLHHLQKGLLLANVIPQVFSRLFPYQVKRLLKQSICSFDGVQAEYS